MLKPGNMSLKRLPIYLLLGASLAGTTSCFKKVDVAQTSQSVGLMDVAPLTGPKNSIINISGFGFPDASGITVTINGKPAQIVSSTGNGLQVRVPVNAGSGPVVVSFNGNNYTGPNFTYQNSSFEVTSVTTGARGMTDGPLATAEYEDIESIAIDANDNIYNAQYDIAQTPNVRNAVRKLNLNSGTVSTLSTDIGGPAEFISVDAQGNLYLAEENNSRIVKITQAGDTSTLATAPFAIQGIKVGASGAIYVSGPTTIAKYSNNGALAWRLESHDSSAATVEGDTSVAKFNLYGGIEVDPSETQIYVQQTTAAGQPSSVLLLDLNAKTITTLVGAGTRGYVDGDAASARFGFIYSTLLDKEGGLYIADQTNNAIRYYRDGVVRTVIGGTQGDLDANGQNAQLDGPQAMAWDSKGNLYIADWNNNKIKKVVIQ